MGKVSSFGDVISAAGTGPLALVALVSLLLSTLALRMFSQERTAVKIAIFVVMFMGVAGLVLALMNGLGELKSDKSVNSTEKPVSTKVTPETNLPSVEVVSNDSMKSEERTSSRGASTPASSYTKKSDPIRLAENCRPGPYIGFFDWDQTKLNVLSKGIFALSINAFKDCSNVVMVINGHTDTSEDSSMELSEDRTLAVMDYMVRNGIPGQSIRRNPFGSSRPLVPTADGVRESQNRRVEVTLR